jgi:hypothetical protein
VQEAHELERVSLWQDFLLESDTSPDRHPVALFGKPVVDRIFAGSSSWHWRQLAWPSLIGLSVSLAFLSWFALRSPDSTMLGWCSGAVAVVSLVGAFHLWNDHRSLPIGELHLLATTEEQHAWLDRLDSYQKRIGTGEKKVYSGNDIAVLDFKLFTGNSGRILILDSCYGRTDRARKYRANQPPFVDSIRPITMDQTETEPSVASTEPSAETISDLDSEQSDCEAGQFLAASDAGETESKSLPASDSQVLPTNPVDSDAPANSASQVKPHHHLYGLKQSDLEEYLDNFLATKRWNNTRKAQFRVTQRAAYDLIQIDPNPHQGELVGKVRKQALDEYRTELTLGDVSISKQIGNGEAHRNSEFRRFVLQKRNQPAELLPKIQASTVSDQELLGNTE